MLKVFVAFYKTLKHVRFKKLALYLAAATSLLSPLAEGAALTLIIPLLNGLVNRGDFSNVLTAPELGNLFYFFNITDNKHLFLTLSLMILFSMYTKVLFNYLNRISTLNLAVDFEFNTKSKLFEKYLLYPKKLIDKQAAGSHIFSLGSTNVLFEIINYMNELLCQIGFLSIYLIMLLAISCKLTSLIVLALPFVYFPTKRLVHILINNAGNAFVNKEKLNIYSSDMISNMDLVRLFSKEQKELHQFKYLSDSIRKDLHSQNRKLALIPGITEIVSDTFIIFVLIISVVYYFSVHDLYLALFLMYFPVLHRFINKIPKINDIRCKVIPLCPFIANILDILCISTPDIKEGNLTFGGLQSSVIFKNVAFSHDCTKQTLSGINLTINKGDIVAIIGHSGSGKTSLVNLIPRLYDCTHGDILIDGINIKDFSLDSLRNKISIVNQEIMIFNDTIRNNITYGINYDIDENKILDISKLSRTHDFIMKMPNNYDTIIGSGGVELSLGEKQRLAIARALLRDSDILIMDEATNSLDSDTEHQIQRAIEHLLINKTTLVIAHRLSTIKYSSFIVVLDEGKIIEMGRFEDLIKINSRFKYYWDLQNFY